jgi:asparagine synthase (glutamine-hydrolysing)
MSIILGVLEERDASASEARLRKLAIPTERYATGANSIYVSGRLGMVSQPGTSHHRQEMEQGPVSNGFGNVLSFDGRLDNFRELAGQLDLAPESTADCVIVLHAFARWGDACFRRFTGDWAIAVWSEHHDTLYLARDHAGTRTLYYRYGPKRLEWATHLDSFFAEGRTTPLSDAYIAAYLAGQQIRDLTPYKDIYAVPPGSFLAVHRGAIASHRHWSAFGESEIEYCSDQEYDAVFLALFQQAVERRTQDGAPVLAELSGGMDSTSIVCMSDHLRRTTDFRGVLLDTVSYYDDEEASLDERRYFSITEAKRGKVGTHLDMAFSQRTFRPHDAAKGHYLLPGADSLSIIREEQFQGRVWSRGYRAILSGIGGDELLGGIPDPYPELSGYLMDGRWRELFGQSIAWSLVDRSPLGQMLFRTLRYTLFSYMGRDHKTPVPPWLSTSVQERAVERAKTLAGTRSRWEFRPHQHDNDRMWWAVMETLPHCFPRILARPEYRYPYLDKDLVNYLLRVPRNRLLRPGRRRALMRRALLDIVPQEILERKRKAFQLHAPLATLQRSHESLRRLFADSALVQAGFIEADPLKRELDAVHAGNTRHWHALIQTIALELWLQSNRLACSPGHARPWTKFGCMTSGLRVPSLQTARGSAKMEI